MFIEENPQTLKEGEMSDLDTIAHLRAVNAKLLEALEGMKCWDCEYPLTQPGYDGCYSCKAEGHHEDYGKPLDVIWICRDHHAELHKEAKK